MDEKLKWKQAESRHIIENKWIDFREEKWTFPDGRTIGPFYSYSRKDYAVIAALDEKGRYLCVRQFRQGIRSITTEFPAGGIEVKHPEEKDAFAAAKRELKEETGYESDQWDFLMKVPSDPTNSDNYAWIYLAHNCHAVSDPQPDDTEFLQTCVLTEKAMQKEIETGQFCQPVHLLALLLTKKNSDNQKGNQPSGSERNR